MTKAIVFRAAGFLPSGVAVLSSSDSEMTVSSLHFVSFGPPIIGVCFETGSRKGAAIIKAGKFAARILKTRTEGVVDLLDCAIQSVTRVGDHDLVLAGVGGVRMLSDAAGALVYWRRGLHEFRPAYDFAATRDGFEAFVHAWELGKLPKSHWSHAAHVAIGACYGVRHGIQALDRIREGILRYNAAAGTANTDTSGYHETLTRFWAEVLAKETRHFSDEWLAARHALAKYGEDRYLHSLYYSFDLLQSVEARRVWIPPDQLPQSSRTRPHCLEPENGTSPNGLGGVLDF